MWHKRWQNEHPGWTRRVTWYNVPNTNGERVHLRFDERLPNNDGRERWDVVVARRQAVELWDEYRSDEFRDAKDIFIEISSEQEQND